MSRPPVFVGREHQLAQLDGFLDEALAGRGQVCFITGDAGAGKTTLAVEFARRAEARQQDLLVAVGMGDPQTGASDPYLIFREVLTMLTGDAEARLAQGAITQEGARRLNRTVRTSIDCLVEFGPDLIGLLVPGANLAVQLTKVGIEASKKAGLMERLTQAPAPERKDVPGSKGIDQGQIFEQYAKVLKALAGYAPLLLVLDDLQWADNSSIDLLFHLVRRTESSRILIVGLFRPAEVAVGRGAERHPLERVVTELKRYRGDVLIDLDGAAQREGADFVNAYLDTEPNRLDPAFRRALYDRTSGNPLFVVELLRTMQEQGDIVLDERGGWIVGPSLDWSKLPARTEGVIEARISRLTADLLEVLKLASVQGEAFTAEVVAQLRDLNMREFVHQLSSDLEKRHRLVSAQGQQRVGEQRVSQYQFQNRQFQQYLYAAMDATERAYLHEDIGRAMEGLYGDRVDEVAVRLAWHFEEAGIPEHAAGDYELETRSRLQLAFVLYRRGEYAASREQGNLVLAAAEESGLKLVQADALRLLGQLGQTEASFAASQQYLDRSLALCREIGDRRSEARTMGTIAINYRESGNFAEARSWYLRALAILREVGDRRNEAMQLNNLAVLATSVGDLASARDYLAKVLVVGREKGDRLTEGAAQVNLSTIVRMQGDFQQALTYAEDALAIFNSIGSRFGEGHAAMRLGNALLGLGRLDEAAGAYQQAVTVRRRLNEQPTVLESLAGLARVHLAQRNLVQALSDLQEVLDHLVAAGHVEGAEEPYWIDLTCYRVLRANDDARAETILQNAYKHLRAQADAISDPVLRHSYLNNIPQHRELVYEATGAYPVADHAPDETAPSPALAAAGPVLPSVLPPPLEPDPYLASPLIVPELPGAAAAAPPTFGAGAEATPPPHPAAIATTVSAPESLPVSPAATLAGPDATIAPQSLQTALAARLAVHRRPAALAAVAVTVAVAAGLGLLRLAGSGAPAGCPPACTGADLAYRDLRGAELVGADLSQADLYAARLGEVDLTAASLISATLAAADLKGALLLAVDAEGANLAGANLAGADLRGANLRQADLAGAILIGADLTSADLTGADLTGAQLLGARLVDADLEGANLRAAVLVPQAETMRVLLSESPAPRFLSREVWAAMSQTATDLTDVHYSAATRWPHGFIPPASPD